MIALPSHDRSIICFSGHMQRGESCDPSPCGCIITASRVSVCVEGRQTADGAVTADARVVRMFGWNSYEEQRGMHL